MSFVIEADDDDDDDNNYSFQPKWNSTGGPKKSYFGAQDNDNDEYNFDYGKPSNNSKKTKSPPSWKADTNTRASYEPTKSSSHSHNTDPLRSSAPANIMDKAADMLKRYSNPPVKRAKQPVRPSLNFDMDEMSFESSLEESGGSHFKTKNFEMSFSPPETMFSPPTRTNSGKNKGNVPAKIKSHSFDSQPSLSRQKSNALPDLSPGSSVNIQHHKDKKSSKSKSGHSNNSKGKHDDDSDEMDELDGGSDAGQVTSDNEYQDYEIGNGDVTANSGYNDTSYDQSNSSYDDDSQSHSQSQSQVSIPSRVVVNTKLSQISHDVEHDRDEHEYSQDHSNDYDGNQRSRNNHDSDSDLSYHRDYENEVEDEVSEEEVEEDKPKSKFNVISFADLEDAAGWDASYAEDSHFEPEAEPDHPADVTSTSIVEDESIIQESIPSKASIPVPTTVVAKPATTQNVVNISASVRAPAVAVSSSLHGENVSSATDGFSSTKGSTSVIPSSKSIAPPPASTLRTIAELTPASASASDTEENDDDEINRLKTNIQQKNIQQQKLLQAATAKDVQRGHVNSVHAVQQSDHAPVIGAAAGLSQPMYSQEPIVPQQFQHPPAAYIPAHGTSTVPAALNVQSAAHALYANSSVPVASTAPVHTAPSGIAPIYYQLPQIHQQMQPPVQTEPHQQPAPMIQSQLPQQQQSQSAALYTYPHMTNQPANYSAQGPQVSGYGYPQQQFAQYPPPPAAGMYVQAQQPSMMSGGYPIYPNASHGHMAAQPGHPSSSIDFNRAFYSTNSFDPMVMQLLHELHQAKLEAAEANNRLAEVILQMHKSQMNTQQIQNQLNQHQHSSSSSSQPHGILHSANSSPRSSYSPHRRVVVTTSQSARTLQKATDDEDEDADDGHDYEDDFDEESRTNTPNRSVASIVLDDEDSLIRSDEEEDENTNHRNRHQGQQSIKGKALAVPVKSSVVPRVLVKGLLKSPKKTVSPGGNTATTTAPAVHDKHKPTIASVTNVNTHLNRSKSPGKGNSVNNPVSSSSNTRFSYNYDSRPPIQRQQSADEGGRGSNNESKVPVDRVGDVTDGLNSPALDDPLNSALLHSQVLFRKQLASLRQRLQVANTGYYGAMVRSSSSSSNELGTGVSGGLRSSYPSSSASLSAALYAQMHQQPSHPPQSYAMNSIPGQYSNPVGLPLPPHVYGSLPLSSLHGGVPGTATGAGGAGAPSLDELIREYQSRQQQAANQMQSI